ncbi:MAG: hypothetical protein ACR2NZ_01640 [Rubripirellula sp.]
MNLITSPHDLLAEKPYETEEQITHDRTDNEEDENESPNSCDRLAVHELTVGSRREHIRLEIT